jgi:hypothetical protein
MQVQQMAPMTWHKEGDPGKLLEAVENNLDVYDRWLSDNDMPRVLDEVAVLVPNVGHALALIERLVKAPGFEYFNGAKDRVHTWPFHTNYGVQYHFVRTPAHYRLEIMHMERELQNGFSPLHAAMWPNGAPNAPDASYYRVVHFSYKLPDLDDYRDEKRELAQVGATCGQHCASTYGQFSYWLPDCAERLVWLKPRVNIRDAA